MQRSFRKVQKRKCMFTFIYGGSHNPKKKLLEREKPAQLQYQRRLGCRISFSWVQSMRRCVKGDRAQVQAESKEQSRVSC